MNIKTVILPIHILFISLLLLLTSCGSGGDNGSNDIIAPQVPISTLPGAEDTLAVGVIFDLDAITGIPDSEIEEDETGVRIARTQLDIGFSKTATVGQVNALLKSIDGSIIAMLEGVAGFLVRFPDPGSLDDLEILAGQLEANPLIRWVQMTYYVSPNELPPDIPPDSLAISPIAHHLAIKGHALWNVQDILSTPGIDPPVLVVADAFGGGLPNGDFEAIFVESDFVTNNPDPHGYSVSSVIVADYGGDTIRGMVTGLYPGKPIVRVVDIQEPLTLQGAGYRSLFIIKEYAPYPVVLNTSLGHTCDNAAQALAWCNEETARRQALTWIEKVRDSGLEDKYIHITAAGNIKSGSPNDTNAMFNSQFASAALFTDLTENDGAPVPHLKNTLVVEDLMRTPDNPPKPACLSTSSKYHGNISAIGTDISLLGGANTGETVSSGTSYAAPQVAGLATWVWALAPSLTNHEVIKRLNDTAETVNIYNPANSTLNCAAIVPAKVINAYSAALSTDTGNIPTPANSPMRSTLMDINNDDIFDEQDIQLLLDMYLQQNGELDYSRYDLNGDGYTGGGATSRFDLNLDVAFTTASQIMSGSEIIFDESGVTDGDIMCYYAYSALYTGNTKARDSIIGSRCGIQDCVYHEIYNGPGDFYYRKVCWDPQPIIIIYEHSEGSGFSSITVTKRGCNAPIYVLEDYECPDGDFFIFASVVYSYNSWVNESGIALFLETAPGVTSGTAYYCDDYGTLRKSDPVTGNSDIGEYGDLDSCHTALKTYIPGDPTVFDHPGDCHEWWDHGTEACKK